MTRQQDCVFAESDNAFHAHDEQMCWLVGTFFGNRQYHTQLKSLQQNALSLCVSAKEISLGQQSSKERISKTSCTHDRAQA